MRNRAIVPAFVAASLIYAVCASNAHAVELLNRMSLRMKSSAEAKCGAAVQKSAKQKGASEKKAGRNILKNLVSHIQKSSEPKCGKAKASPKQKSGKAKASPKQKGGSDKKGRRVILKSLVSHIQRAAEPKCGGKAKSSPKQKSDKAKASPKQKSSKAKASPKQKSSKGGKRARNLLDRVIGSLSPKCGCEPKAGPAPVAKVEA